MLLSSVCRVYALQNPEASTAKAGRLTSAVIFAEACHAMYACWGSMALTGLDRCRGASWRCAGRMTRRA